MALTQVDTATASTYSATATITADVNVAEGDLIVIGATGGTDAIYPDTFADENSNNYSVGTLRTQSTSASLRLAYCIANTTNAANTITVTFTAGTSRRTLRIAVFRPDAGDTVTLHDSAYQCAYEASPWETATFDITGDNPVDVVAVAFVKSGGTITFSNHEVPSGTAATVIETDEATATGFYKILTSTVSSAIAEIDVNTAGNYAMEVYVFKATAAGGSTVPQAMQHYMRLRAD
jgi:hypothetical protein